MSPEQAAGRPLDHRSDIFSFGALVYEMVTGRRAFQGDTAMTTLTQILGHDPPPIAQLAPNVPPRLERVIARCLQKDLSRRFQNIGEVKPLLEDILRDVTRRDVTRRYWIAAAAALLIATALLVGRPPSPEMAASKSTKANAGTDAARNAAPARRSVAVLDFRNVSGAAGSAWLSTALAEMFSSELGTGEQLRIIPGENVGRMKVELALPEAESYAPSTLARIRANLNADVVVLGSFLHLVKDGGNQIRIDVRLQDAASGRTIASMAETGDEARLFDLVLRCGEGLRRRLGVAAATESQTRSLQASLPTNQRALQLYSEALLKIRRFESMAARDRLLAAIKEEPGNAMIRSTLSAVHTLLGADKLAVEEARKAFEQSAGLSREQQLLIEGRYRAASRERDKAITIFRALLSFFPDNVDYGVMLARNQYQAGKGKEALATIEELQKLPAPLSQDPQIPLTEAFAAMALSDFPRELSASTRAARAAAAVNARLLVARARIPEAWALRNLGRPAEARKSLEEAYRIYQEAGDRHGMVETLNPLAILHYDERDLVGAGKHWEQALAYYRETGARYATLLALQNLAVVQMDLWNLDAARRFYQEGLEISLEIDRKSAIGAAHSGLAEVTRYLGNLNESFDHYTQALNVTREAGDLSRAAEALFGQAQVFRLKGDLNRARQLHAQALKLRQETRQPAHEAASHLAIARLAMDSRRFAEAESEARLSEEAFTRLKRATSVAEAGILVAESLLERKRTAEAAAMLPPIEEGLKRGDYTQLARLDLLRAKSTCCHRPDGRGIEVARSPHWPNRHRPLGTALRRALPLGSHRAAARQRTGGPQDSGCALRRRPWQGLQAVRRQGIQSTPGPSPLTSALAIKIFLSHFPRFSGLLHIESLKDLLDRLSRRGAHRDFPNRYLSGTGFHPWLGTGCHLESRRETLHSRSNSRPRKRRAHDRRKIPGLDGRRSDSRKQETGSFDHPCFHQADFRAAQGLAPEGGRNRWGRGLRHRLSDRRRVRRLFNGSKWSDISHTRRNRRLGWTRRCRNRRRYRSPRRRIPLRNGLSQ